MDRIDALAFFTRIVEKGGVAKAGRDFGMSAQTASDRLAALEEHYGATLLTRTTRSISLTEEGKVLLEAARHLVSEATDLEAQIKYGAQRLSGLIRVSAPQDLGEHMIAPIIDDFMDSNPEIEIDLNLSDEHIDLISSGVDLAIRLGTLKDSSMMIKKLGDNRRIVCAAPGYLKQNGIPKHPDDLPGHNCLVMRFGAFIDREWTFNIKDRERRLTVSGNRTANSGAQVHRWCVESRGIALKSIWDVKSDLDAGRLVEILAEYSPKTKSQLQIVYPGGTKPSRRIKALVDHISADFQI